MDMVKFWERKYQRNLGRIVAICYRYVNDRAVAEDLAQDVFVKAMEKFTTIRAIGRFDTSPVIITTKIPVHQTVVIRDTTTISDTVFFNYE